MERAWWENTIPFTPCCTRSLTATRYPLFGNRIVNVVPLPSWLSAAIEPWCSSIMPFTTVSPNPVPLPNSLVVKNGSNTLAITS